MVSQALKTSPSCDGLVTEMPVFCYFWDLNKETPPPPLEACFGNIQLGKDTTRGIVFLGQIWPRGHLGSPSRSWSTMDAWNTPKKAC